MITTAVVATIYWVNYVPETELRSLYYVSESTQTVGTKCYYPHFIDMDIETNQIEEQSWDSEPIW